MGLASAARKALGGQRAHPHPHLPRRRLTPSPPTTRAPMRLNRQQLAASRQRQGRESRSPSARPCGENGRVIVTACLGAEPDYITRRPPTASSAVTLARTSTRAGPRRPSTAPSRRSPIPSSTSCPARASHSRPTPNYSYPSKIAEAVTTAAISASPRHGAAASPPAPPYAVIREAERLVDWPGPGKLLVIFPGHLRLRRRHRPCRGAGTAAPYRVISPAIWALSAPGPAVKALRLPLTRGCELIPADGRGAGAALSDIPFQHAHPDTLLKRNGPPLRPDKGTLRDRRVARGLPRHSPCAPPFHRGLVRERTEAEFALSAGLAGGGASSTGLGLVSIRENVQGRASKRLAGPCAG